MSRDIVEIECPRCQHKIKVEIECGCDEDGYDDDNGGMDAAELGIDPGYASTDAQDVRED